MKGGADAFVAMGSNKGNRLGNLRRAAGRLCTDAALELSEVSPVYLSEAHVREPGVNAPPFLNAVAWLQTSLDPAALLALLLSIENEYGRRRSRHKRWEPRTLDLDLLLFDDQVVSTSTLKVPHPRMAQRRFVLRPLADIAVDRHVPFPFEKTVAELLEDCPDKAALQRTDLRLNIGG